MRHEMDAKEVRQDKRLRRLYGISLRQYRMMFKLQKGRCALCRRVPKSTLHVDHDHKSGRVRGLLDYYCNRRVVGRHRDPELLRRAADYLESTFDGRALGADGASFRGAQPSSHTPVAPSPPS